MLYKNRAVGSVVICGGPKKDYSPVHWTIQPLSLMAFVKSSEQRKKDNIRVTRRFWRVDVDAVVENSTFRRPDVQENPPHENLPGVAIRCGQDRPDEYGKAAGKT